MTASTTSFERNVTLHPKGWRLRLQGDALAEVGERKHGVVAINLARKTVAVEDRLADRPWGNRVPDRVDGLDSSCCKPLASASSA
jgi:hypothetical protein